MILCDSRPLELPADPGRGDVVAAAVADAAGLSGEWVVCVCERLWACRAAPPMRAAVCRRCGSRYSSPTTNTRYCGPECRDEARSEKRARYKRGAVA